MFNETKNTYIYLLRTRFYKTNLITFKKRNSSHVGQRGQESSLDWAGLVLGQPVDEEGEEVVPHSLQVHLKHGDGVRQGLNPGQICRLTWDRGGGGWGGGSLLHPDLKP